MTEQIQLKAIPVLKDNYVWLLIVNNTQQTIIVDPGESEPVIQFLQANQLKPSAIFLTHHHHDHCQGATAIKALFNIPVYGKADPRKPVLTQAVDEGDTFVIADVEFTILAIPGHTHDHIAFYTPGHLFCGDVLFSAGCGRLFEGSAEQMFASLLKLRALPEDTLIYCGHEYTLANLAFAKAVEPYNQDIASYINLASQKRAQQLPTLPSTLALEKKVNPFLRCDEEALINSLAELQQVKFNSALERFTYLRSWKNEFKYNGV